MKFDVAIEIYRPVDEVLGLFDNAENLYVWMEGLEDLEHLSGTPGEVGARFRMKFNMNGRTIEMIETLTAKDLPREFTATYETDGVINVVRNRFEPVGETRTLYTSENEFRLSGMMKIIGWLMPGEFKKTSVKYLKAFKEFAESSR